MKKTIPLLSSSIALCISASAIAAPVSIHVLSATIKDENIPDAEVFLQKNGENTATARTGSDGRTQINSSLSDTSDNLLIIKKPGYSTLVAKCPCDGMTYALSPVLKDLNSMRIVLNLGKTPADPDSHLSYKDQHVFLAEQAGAGCQPGCGRYRFIRS